MLTFDALRGANLARLPKFKNARGEPAHSKADGSDWSLSQWSNAVLGELGEAANIIKKIERGDMTLDEARPALGREFADVQTYLDILAYRAGVDLGTATLVKWNEVSARVNCDVRLEPLGWTVGAQYFAHYEVRHAKPEQERKPCDQCSSFDFSCTGACGR